MREAATWLAARGVDEQVLVIGATHEAASELIREAARGRGSGFGWHRMTLGRLAAELAKNELAALRLAPVGMLPIEALCARVIHGLADEGKLGRLAAVAHQPGLPRALARTLTELRMAGVGQSGATTTGPSGATTGAGATTFDDPVIAAALQRLEVELGRARLADRARVFELAIRAAERGHALLGLPVLFVDVPVRSRVERAFVEAIAARAPDTLATVPAGDEATFVATVFGEVEALAGDVDDALGRVQRHLFDRGRLNYAELDPSIEMFSAPGESRECVELARRVVKEASRGMPFDRMAVVLRTPGHYRSHLEEALGRAGVPVHFEQGTVRPDPSGRALLALLACAADGLSARRFAEYVSLAEVPGAIDGAPPPAAPPAERWVAPDEELAPAALSRSDDDDDRGSARSDGERARSDDDHRHAVGNTSPLGQGVELAPRDAPVAAGTLRAPWRWERLLVDAAVIGGRDRWERRLAGLAARLRLDDSESGREHRERAVEDLAHLRNFAMPLLDDLAALPERATWGEWIDRLGALATRALRSPERVLSVLSALVPMSDVGAIGLREVQRVLSPRLSELIVRAGSRRYGKLLVAPIDAMRGLTFDVVFVPGLAERMFPQKVIEDPLLLDAAREGLAIELATRERRIGDERLALRLAIGAASQRAVLSYPRIDLDQGRPRVPSFYALEVLEAAEGALPGFDELGKRADATGAARIGWPAPADRMEAIDEAEHDLALLDGWFRSTIAAPAGVAAYLLTANPHLARSLRFRARRWTVNSWKPADGLIAGGEAGRAAIAAHAPAVRSFSPTALEQLAQCPYRFALKTIVKLEPREQPEAIETLGPLERGSLIHDVQFELLGELRDAGLLPVKSLEEVRERVDVVLARVAARYRDDLCPAIDRVWDDGIATIGADVREWVRRMAEQPEWIPRRFELAFGPVRGGARDPASVAEPVDLGIGLTLRGSIDLVEEHVSGALRATDYKTGIARVRPGSVIGKGQSLQPVLYALVLERMFRDVIVEAGRLYYCTTKGEFRVVDVALGEEARAAARTLVDTLADRFEHASFPAAPEKDACTYCDFRPICGPYEVMRSKAKLKHQPLVQLAKLRSTP